MTKRLTDKQARDLNLETLYNYTDEELGALLKRIQRRFERLRRDCTSLDDLHVLRAVQTAYKELDKDAQDTYKRIVRYYLDDMDYLLLSDLLGLSNPVTGYVWTAEVKRKQERLYEAILAERSTVLPSGKTETTPKPYTRSMHLWSRQVGEYAVQATDAALLKRYESMGDSQVMWVTRRDERVCPDCSARDKKVYNINRVPGKPHPGCRCILIPISGRQRSR